MAIISTDQSSDGDVTVAFTADDQTITIKSGVVVENTRFNPPNTPPSGTAVSSGFAGSLLNNDGSIYARNVGVSLFDAGTLHNSEDATISARNGVELSEGRASLVNDGLIAGTAVGVTYGLTASDSQYFDILNTGTISGRSSGIFCASGYMALVNAGTIDGGIFSRNANCSITNSGVITGELFLGDIFTTIGSSIVNTGRIDGDILFGAGADTFDGRGGSVSGDIFGGGGDDIYIVGSLAMAYQVIELDGEGTDMLAAAFSMKSASFENIEHLKLLGSGAFNLQGDARANILSGNAGNNTLAGGAGDDSYYVQNAGDRVVEAAGGGRDTVFAQNISWTLGAELENLNLLSSTGTSGLKATGNTLDNTIIDGRGSSILDGGAGADYMSGGGGSDTYYVDNVGDVVAGEDVNPSFGAYDTLYTSVSFSVLGQMIEKIIVQGTVGLRLTGSDGKNEFVDGAGVDTLIGGKNDDVYNISQTGDVVTEKAGEGIDVVLTKSSYALAAGQEIEQLKAADAASTKALTLVGNDVFTPQFQTLVGNAGVNVLDGRGGSDVLTGLGGADTFVFRSALGVLNVDQITDFSHADDTIRLSKSVFAALPTGALAASAFKDLTSGAIDADDRILYNRVSGGLFYDVDGSGSQTSRQFAILVNIPTLDATDFVVVA